MFGSNHGQRHRLVLGEDTGPTCALAGERASWDRPKQQIDLDQTAVSTPVVFGQPKLELPSYFARKKET